MNTNQKKYTAFMESVCDKFNCTEMLPALTEGFKAFCEATSKDSFQPVEQPLEISTWYIGKDDGEWGLSDQKRRSHTKAFKVAINHAADNFEPGTAKVSPIYKGDMHGEPNENGEYYCVKITGKLNSKYIEPEYYVTCRRVMYEDPNKQFGQDVLEDYYDDDWGKWRKRYKDNYKPNKPDSYYNHSPEDRHKLRNYVDKHQYSKYRGMGMWDHGAIYDEEKALSPNKDEDYDSEHASEREMERRAEEAFMNSAYGEGNWSY